MARERRVYSVAERNELWERWRRGETISDIGRALDRAPGTIFCTLTERGGVAPRPRRRSRLALTLPEREEISRGIAAGESDLLTLLACEDVAALAAVGLGLAHAL